MHLQFCCDNKMASVVRPHCADSSALDQSNVCIEVTWFYNVALQNKQGDGGRLDLFYLPFFLTGCYTIAHIWLSVFHFNGKINCLTVLHIFLQDVFWCFLNKFAAVAAFLVNIAHRINRCFNFYSQT